MVKNIVKTLTLPVRWTIPVLIVLGIICGLGMYIFDAEYFYHTSEPDKKNGAVPLVIKF